MSVYDLDCVSASDRRRCPCHVVGFHLSFGLCLGCCLFLGERFGGVVFFLLPLETFNLVVLLLCLLNLGVAGVMVVVAICSGGEV